MSRWLSELPRDCSTATARRGMRLGVLLLLPFNAAGTGAGADVVLCCCCWCFLLLLLLLLLLLRCRGFVCLFMADTRSWCNSAAVHGCNRPIGWLFIYLLYTVARRNTSPLGNRLGDHFGVAAQSDGQDLAQIDARLSVQQLVAPSLADHGARRD